MLFGFAEIKGAKISLLANLPTSGQQIMGFAECKELVCVLGETSDGQRPSLICFCLKTGFMLVPSLCQLGWLGSRVVSVLDSGAEGPG